MEKKIIGIFMGILLIATTLPVVGGIVNETDLDPLVDLAVTVEIKQIRSLENSNLQTPSIEKIDWLSDPDFYIKVFINDIEFISPIWNNTKYVSNPQWSATLDVSDEEEFVNIKIQLWDWNSGIDKLCDISGHSDDLDKFDIDLSYSVKTGHWLGDDFAYYDPIDFDPSGYGRLNGCDDGSIHERDRDCELWFDIYQNDFDHDGIPYWTEVNVYNTDPEEDNTDQDTDDDGVPVQWEHKWGHYMWYNWRNQTYEHEWIYHPMKWDDHANLDPDEDGLDNVEEYLTSQWNSDPFRQDIFLEIDQMEIGPNGEGSTLPELTKNLLKTAFDGRNIVLHIDDGCMGGGQTDIPFYFETNHQNLRNIYLKYFLNGDTDYWRKGIFHYAIIDYKSSYPGFVFVGNDSLDSIQIATKPHDQIAERYPIINRLYWAGMNKEDIRAIVYAGAIMHETGHTLSIFNSNTPGCDDQESKFPWQINYWKWGPYKSCMNYRYTYRLVDYSDGSRGKNDFDDWGFIDLTFFQRSLW